MIRFIVVAIGLLAASQASAQTDCYITRANFDKLYPGMTYQAVVKTLGCEATKVGQIYSWKIIGTGQVAEARFQNGVMLDKGQIK
jgi:hypothetical protein